jgi:hypothetical protein
VTSFRNSCDISQKPAAERVAEANRHVQRGGRDICVAGVDVSAGIQKDTQGFDVPDRRSNMQRRPAQRRGARGEEMRFRGSECPHRIRVAGANRFLHAFNGRGCSARRECFDVRFQLSPARKAMLTPED